MTRIAVISDIHGNCVALDAVLADIQRASIDQIVCLGDAIQGGAQPAQTVQRLREVGFPVVMGNADAWLLSGIDTGGETITAEQESVRQWSLAQLSDADRASIAAFAPTVIVPLTAEHDLLCFHGSPTSFDDILLPNTDEEEYERLLGPYAPAIMCGGHTHWQQVHRLGETFFFNPGSVGLAYNHDQPEDDFRLDPWAEYAILSEMDRTIGLEFRRVPLPLDAVRQALRESGRPGAQAFLAQYG
jgi:putative phosphoesterase